MTGRLKERTTQATVAQRFRTALEQRDFGAIEALFTPDALFDANLPSWRLRRHGHQAITRQLEAWFLDAPARFVEWHERRAGPDAVVECVESRADGGEELSYRQVLLFAVERDRIANLTLYCTGAWDAETLERYGRQAEVVP